VNDVFIFETANDLDDGVNLADGGEEFVTESSALRSSFYKSGDVDKFDGGWDDLCGIGHLREFVQAVIRDGDHAHIGVDGAEGIVRSLGIASAGEGIKEGGFPDIGHSYDSGLEHDAEALA